MCINCKMNGSSELASRELVICEMVSREWMSSEQYNNVDCKVSSD